ncbi:MAG TPA: hypothetical protein VL201_00060 [Patescibacteria group bacterium]|jgi:hypothetical protein|nr:hypothetical protein [Patescibacteria group bacterium]
MFLYKYKLFIIGFIGTVFSLNAMENEEAIEKSVKWPLLALRQSGIPQDLQRIIFKNYIDLSRDLDTKAYANLRYSAKIQDFLLCFNLPERLKKYNGTKINEADLRWLGSSDELNAVYHATKNSDVHGNLIDDTVDRDTDTSYNKAISLPLWFRCKVGIHNNKSIKWPMLALKQSGIPQELQHIILQKYTGVSYDQQKHSKLSLPISRLNDEERLKKDNGAKITKEDIMWLDYHDKQKLISAEKAISLFTKRNDEVSEGRAQNIPPKYTALSYNEALPKEKYNEIISLSLPLRRKLGIRCPVGVQADKYDLRPEEKRLLIDRSLGGGAVGVGLYGLKIGLDTTMRTGLFGFTSLFSLPWAFLSYVTGAGLSFFGSWFNLMKRKDITPDEPWVQTKYLCPEANNPFHALYWQKFNKPSITL